MKLVTVPLTASNQNDALAFLSKYEDTSIFLLGNLREHGPVMTSHVNSGNFNVIKHDEMVVCVFCLTRRGNLLAQTTVLEPVLFETVVNSCKEETVPIHGVIADWTFAKPFWQYLKDKKVISKEGYNSKEISYSLLLDQWHRQAHHNARALKTEDYPQWKTLREEYLVEQGLPQDISAVEMYDEFSRKAAQEIIWGMFQGSQMVSIGELNARTDHLAIVGGVYTMPKLRRQGLATELMGRLISDCKNKLHISKLIIFTGEEENKPAQRLYESLGCRHIGYMGLLFGE